MLICPSCALEGNKKSLSGAMENGVDLRECIVKLYKEYYHGGLMKLVVIGGGKFSRCMMCLAVILGKSFIYIPKYWLVLLFEFIVI